MPAWDSAVRRRTMRRMRRPPVTPDPVAAGQESVWDYPRPPRLVRSTKHVTMRLGDALVADTTRAWRVLETSHPPTWYIPPRRFRRGGCARRGGRARHCEWKGAATYWDVVTPTAVWPRAVWSYETPDPRFADIAGSWPVTRRSWTARSTANASTAGGRLLRRLDHLRRGRPVQGRPGQLGLVTLRRGKARVRAARAR